jgi:hypothetical protein
VLFPSSAETVTWHVFAGTLSRRLVECTPKRRRPGDAFRKKPQSLRHEVRVRISITALALVLMGSVAEAASVPLPRPRPVAMQKTVPLPPVRPSVTAQEPAPAPVVQEAAPAAKPEEPKTAEAPPQPSACQVALKAIAVFVAEPPVKGAGQCGITDPVRLEAVILKDQARVSINPPAVLRCEMATAVTRWIRDDMAPTTAQLGSALRGIENFDSYDCRGRNRVFGAKMSEHGRGNALDIKAVRLDSGVLAHLTDPHVAKAVRNDVRKSACDRFMTVLGPGSDGYHENHIHVDLAERRSDYRMCQWEVRQPLDRASPSPHIAQSRAPTPLETMPSGEAIAVSATTPLPRPRRAAERR